jgi:hypothetical protein
VLGLLPWEGLPLHGVWWALTVGPCAVGAVATQERIDEVNKALIREGLPFGAKASQPMPLEAYAFREDPKEAKTFWDVRKGLIPIVGGARETGASLACMRSLVAAPQGACTPPSKPGPWRTGRGGCCLFLGCCGAGLQARRS